MFIFNSSPNLDLLNPEDEEKIINVAEALSNRSRLEILRQLQKSPYAFTVPVLSQTLKIPKTTLLHHLNVLKKADLIDIRYESSSSTTARLVTRYIRAVSVDLYKAEPKHSVSEVERVQSIGVGCFTDASGKGFLLATDKEAYSSPSDDFFNPHRFGAGLVALSEGTFTYLFSNSAEKQKQVKELTLSLELCSEAPYYNNDYLSDITFWINDVEVATYLSKGDYGDRSGKLSPDWWPTVNTQYGKLVVLTIKDRAVYLNGEQVRSRANINNIRINEGNGIRVTIGNKSTAAHMGGINLFGSFFGDYPQDIVLKTIIYS